MQTELFCLMSNILPGKNVVSIVIDSMALSHPTHLVYNWPQSLVLSGSSICMDEGNKLHNGDIICQESFLHIYPQKQNEVDSI